MALAQENSIMSHYITLCLTLKEHFYHTRVILRLFLDVLVLGGSYIRRSPLR